MGSVCVSLFRRFGQCLYKFVWGGGVSVCVSLFWRLWPVFVELSRRRTLAVFVWLCVGDARERGVVSGCRAVGVVGFGTGRVA